MSRSRRQVTAAEFAAEFARDARLHWCIAAAHAGRALAEDVLQEAAMIALRKLHEFTPGTNLRAWFARIVAHVARNTRRKERAPAPIDADALHAPREPEVSPVAANGRLTRDQQAFDDRLMRALDHLSDHARACLLLRSVLELSYVEIAATLGMPENTAMSHVHRARAEMRAQLSDLPSAL